MVDLPLLPERTVTSTAPQSSVSRADIIGQSDQMAAALHKVAGATMDVATEMAKGQAADDLQKQKVVRNEDGSVSVANPANSIIFGRAGEAYNAAVAAGTIAQHDNVISQTLNDLHQKYPTSPDQFAAAADAWKSKYLEDHGGGQVGLALQQHADQLQTQHFNSITNSTAKIDLAREDSSLSAKQTRARDDVTAMLRNGADINDKAVQGGIAQFDATTEARAANPLFGYSQEQAKLDRDTFHSEAAAGRFLYQTDQIYKDQGPNGGKTAALENAKDILTNPKYQLSQQQREQFYHRAVGEIRANEAIRRQDIGEARAAYTELSLRSAAGGRIESDEVEQVAGAFRAAGDPGGAARVYAGFIRKPLNDDFGRQPLSVQTQQLSAIQGANAAAAAHKFFVGKGYTPEQAAGIVGNLVHESGMNPSAAGDSGTSGGLAQFHNERLTALRAFAASQGKPVTDFQTQLEFIDRELNSTEGATRAKLMAAKTPEEAAGAFIDYERPRGWTPENPTGGLGYESRKALARSVFNRGAGDTSMGPAGSAWLIANRAGEVDDAATKQWKAVMADYGKEGTKPSLQTVNDVVSAARATRNAPLLEAIAHDTDRMDLSGEFGRLSLPEQHARNADMAAAGERGDLAPGMGATQKDLQRRTDAITKGLNDNPIATTVRNFPDKLRAPQPLDFSNDQNLAAGIKTRGQIAQFARQNWDTPPVAALDEPEVAQFQSMLSNPDPAVKGRVFNALSALPEEVRNATLAKIGKDRPEMMVSVAAGSMMKAAPDVAASIIRGQQAIALDKGYLPSKGTDAANFETEFDKRIPASTFGLAARTDVTGPYAVAQGLVKARYADLSAQAADTTGKVNNDRLQRAVDDVTGGVLDHNGGKLIAPVRGMPQSTFDKAMYGITDNDLAGVTSQHGEPITANYLRSAATLESVGDGRYLVKLGKDPLRPIYAYQDVNTEAPRKFMLDLRNRPLGVAPPQTQVAMPFASLSDGDDEERMASGGGTGVYSGGEYDNFRRSDNIEDRRRQRYSQNPDVDDPNYKRGDYAKGIDLSALEKTQIAKMLGMDDLKGDDEKYREKKQQMFDELSRTIRRLRREGSDLPLPQRGRPYIQKRDE